MSKYLPRIRIWNHRNRAIYEPWAIDVLSDDLWRQTSTLPGSHSNLKQTLLDTNKQFIEDPLLGQRVYRPRSISLTNTILFEDHDVYDWIPYVYDVKDPNQEEARTSALNYYILHIISLKKKMGFSAADNIPGNVLNGVTEEQTKKLTDLERESYANSIVEIIRLKVGGLGFLSTDSIGQETGHKGIIWELGASNIKIAYLSKFELEQDRAISFRLDRWKAGPTQVAHEMRFFVGTFSPLATSDKNPNTCYCLVFSKEEGLTFWHFKNMSVTERKRLLRKRDEILDSGRLTYKDVQDIANLKVLIGQLSQKEGGTPSGNFDFTELDVDAITIAPDITEKARLAIEEYRKAIRAIQNSKSKISDANRTKLEEVEEKLFYAKENVRLSEDTQSLYSSNDFTIQFHRRGFISVYLGNGGGNPWIYENKGILKTGQYGTMLPKGSRILVESNGGQWALVVGHPLYSLKGTLKLQPFKLKDITADLVANSSYFPTAKEVIFDLESEELNEFWRVNIDAVGIIDDVNLLPERDYFKDLLCLPGCKIEIKVIQLKPPVITKKGIPIPGEYQFIINFYSDGRYTPELYRAQLYHLGGNVSDDRVLAWDSLNLYPAGAIEGGPFNPYDPNAFNGDPNRLLREAEDLISRKRTQDIIDVTYSETENHSGTYEVRIRDMEDSKAGLPLDLEGRSIDISLINKMEGPNKNKEISLVTHGIIHGPKLTERSKLLKAPFYAHGGLRSQIEFKVNTLEDIANKAVTSEIIGNGKLPNVYIYELLHNVGMRDSEIGFDISNPIPGMLSGSLQHTLPLGEAGKPADIKPELYSSTLEFINRILNDHFPGWKLLFEVDKDSNLMKARIQKSDVIKIRTDLQYSTKLPPYKKLSIRGKVNVSQNLDDYYTAIEIRGALNAQTGKRYSASYVIWEADDHRLAGKTLYFIGDSKPLQLPTNESLKSDLACQLSLEPWIVTKMRPPIYIEVTVPLQPLLYSGTIIWIDGIKVVIEGIKYNSIQKEIGQLMTLNTRIVEDMAISSLVI